ncbi:MAG: cytochrome c [Gemmatimonadales bacterium]
MASLQPEDAVRYLTRRRVGRAALLALALVAACGGDRNRAAGADSAGTAAVTPDAAAMPTPDTGAPAPADSARSAAPDISAGTPSASAPAKPAPAAATTTAPAKKVDTATKHAAAPRPKPAAAQAPTAGTSAQKPQPTQTAAAPAAAPTPSAQDTRKASTGTGETPLRDAYHQAPKDTVTQAVYNGWKQFNLNCARCHGEDVAGTTIAPHLIVSLRGPINTKELFVQTVCAGRPEKGMPAWCALGLGIDKINDIYEYVKGRSDSKISPGRPAVKQQG